MRSLRGLYLSILNPFEQYIIPIRTRTRRYGEPRLMSRTNKFHCESASGWYAWAAGLVVVGGDDVFTRREAALSLVGSLPRYLQSQAGRPRSARPTGRSRRLRRLQVSTSDQARLRKLDVSAADRTVRLAADPSLGSILLAATNPASQRHVTANDLVPSVTGKTMAGHSDD